MKPLLLLLTLALSAPALADDAPAGSRDAAALKAELGKDFAGGVSLRQNQKKWTPEEAKAGAALEALIARGVAVQEIAAVPADISAYEKEIHEVAAKFNLEMAESARAAAVYLARLKAGGIAMSDEQKALVEQRLAQNRFHYDNRALIKSSMKLMNEANMAQVSIMMPFKIDSAVLARNPELAAKYRAFQAALPGADSAAVIGVEGEKVKAEQAKLAARYGTADLSVPAVGAPRRDAVADESVFGRLGRGARNTPIVGSVLEFSGDVASTLYTGAVSPYGTLLRPLAEERNSGFSPQFLAMAQSVSESAIMNPLLYMAPGFSSMKLSPAPPNRAGAVIKSTIKPLPQSGSAIAVISNEPLPDRKPAPQATAPKAVRRVDPPWYAFWQAPTYEEER